ncbi:putative cytosolic IMP-GMP specific 5'-nucleotidase, partial [Dorcoceras hygrometricum]
SVQSLVWLGEESNRFSRAREEVTTTKRSMDGMLDRHEALMKQFEEIQAKKDEEKESLLGELGLSRAEVEALRARVQTLETQVQSLETRAQLSEEESKVHQDEVHVEELREDVPVRNWASNAEQVGLMYSRRKATRGCASAELGFECRAEELRDDVPVWNWASNAEQVGLIRSRRRDTRGCASAELSFECRAGQCGTGLRIPSRSGLYVHVEELCEDVPVRNWDSNAEQVGLIRSRRRATRGCASAELGFECRAGRAYVLT